MNRLYLSDLGGKTLRQQVAQATECAYSTKFVSSPALQEVRSTRGSNVVSSYWEKLVSVQENQTFLHQPVKRKKLYPKLVQSAYIPNKGNFS